MNPQPRERPARTRHTLVQSFRWAWDGLGGATVRERNMRIHLALGVLASAAASIVPMDGAERALLLLAVALVVAGLDDWLEKRGVSSVDQIRGSLSQREIQDPSAFERAQYVHLILSQNI